MIQSPASMDRLVDDYLAAVARACTGLPADRVEDLVADLREHIAVARTQLPQPTEADIRTILDRLGEPATIAAEAHRYEPSVPRSTPAAPPPAVARRVVPYVFALVVFLTVFLLAVGVGVFALVQPGDR